MHEARPILSFDNELMTSFWRADDEQMMDCLDPPYSVSDHCRMSLNDQTYKYTFGIEWDGWMDGPDVYQEHILCNCN